MRHPGAPLELNGALFDFDGTLIDSGPGIRQTLVKTAAQLGLPAPDEQTLRRFIGPPLRHSFMRAYSMNETQAQHAADLYRDILEEDAAYKEAYFYPGILDLVRDLRAAGMKTAIASAKRKPMLEKTLAYFACRDLFDAVCGAPADGAVADKPRITQTALDMIGGPPAVLVGDSDYDAQAAHKVGIPLIAVLWGYGFADVDSAAKFDPSYIVPTVSDLRSLLLEN